MSECISHITFIVKDLGRASAFFEQIFEAEEVYTSEKKSFSLYPEKYFLINNQWIVIMEGEVALTKTYNHVAFYVSEDDFLIYESRINKLGVEIKPSRKRIDGEGKSLYFYDFDNHLFEIHTGTLKERLLQYTINNRKD